MDPPAQPDHYAELGIPAEATPRRIRLAFMQLAKKYHPDKKAPGESIDAVEFRRVHEAYECLIAPLSRRMYDARYPSIREQWARYRNWQRSERDRHGKKRAEDDARRRDEAAVKLAQEQEKERRLAEEKAKEAERQARRERMRRAAQEQERRQRLREEKEKKAQARSEEAAKRAREHQEQAARDRMRREKEEEAEARSAEAAKRRRIEQEKEAQRRLEAIRRAEKLQAKREMWSRMREAAERQQVPEVKVQPANTMDGCPHPQFCWPRKDGRASCSFCGRVRQKWSHRCPKCGGAACPSCMGIYSMAL